MTSLEKILNNEFFPTLRKVMSKWTEAKDIHCFVKIANSVVAEQKAYQETSETWAKSNGYALENGEKSVNPEEISDHLLREYGRFNSESKLTLSGSSEEDRDAFLEEKVKADAILKQHRLQMNELLEKKFEFEIPRLIYVDPKYIRKEIITAQDCYILDPILDLSGVGDPEPDPEEKDPEEEE